VAPSKRFTPRYATGIIQRYLDSLQGFKFARIFYIFLAIFVQRALKHQGNESSQKVKPLQRPFRESKSRCARTQRPNRFSYFSKNSVFRGYHRSRFWHRSSYGRGPSLRIVHRRTVEGDTNHTISVNHDATHKPASVKCSRYFPWLSTSTYLLFCLSFHALKSLPRCRTKSSLYRNFGEHQNSSLCLH
jgi:hypothetical protein